MQIPDIVLRYNNNALELSLFVLISKISKNHYGL